MSSACLGTIDAPKPRTPRRLQRCGRLDGNLSQHSAPGGSIHTTYRFRAHPGWLLSLSARLGRSVTVSQQEEKPHSFSSVSHFLFLSGQLHFLSLFLSTSQVYPTRPTPRLRRPPTPASISRTLCTPKMLLLVSNEERISGLATWTAIHQQRQKKLGSYAYPRGRSV